MQHLHRIAKQLDINIMVTGLPKTEDQLTNDILVAIAQIKNHNLTLRNEKRKAEREKEQAEESRRMEERIRQDTENMTPWERQKYYDSWSGGMS